MPELPEVETMVRGIRPALEGRRIRELEVLDSKLLSGCRASWLRRRVRGGEVEVVTRRGKWVVLALRSGAGVIVIQPRMTGGFWLVEPACGDHVRLIFHIEGSEEPVRFCDTRRLGRLNWYGDLEAMAAACRRSQGTDALEIEVAELAMGLGRTSRAVKAALLDQKIVAGIGNIYADEILHAARLHPSRPANRLRAPEVARIHGAIRPILERAIAAEGTSFDAGYRNTRGVEGGYLAQSTVHRKAGRPCPSCGAEVVKVYMPGLIGRPTYYCPGCQRGRLRG